MVPPSHPKAISRSYVRRSWTFCRNLRHTRHSAVWLGYSLSEDEPALDGTHGCFKYCWSSDLCGKGRFPYLMSRLTKGLTILKVPEKWYPRRYDFFGSSHQVLHIMVILAGLAHMVGLFRAFEFLHNHNKPCG